MQLCGAKASVNRQSWPRIPQASVLAIPSKHYFSLPTLVNIFFFGTEVFESCICVILFFAFPAPWDTVNPKLWGTGGELVPGITSLSLHYLPAVSLLPHPPAFRHLDKLLTADKLSISQQPMSTQVHIKTKEQVNGKDRGLDFPIHLLSDHILILDMCFPLLFPGSIRLLELQGKLCGWKTQCPGVPGRLRF